MSLVPFLLFCTSLFLPACGPKPVPPQSPLDTAPNHYQRGLAAFEAGSLMEAAREFERARALDSRFPGHLVGSAMVAMAQGDYWRARQDLGRALHQDGRFADAHIALGRVVAAEGIARSYPTETWYREALAAYKKAGESEPGNAAVDYHLGLCHLEAGELEAARAAFGRILEQGRGPYLDQARAELEKVQLIERVAPGAAWGMKIARLPRITRAELAVLLLEELRVDDLVRQRRLPARQPQFFAPGQDSAAAPPRAADLSGCWAQPWIEEILRLEIPGLEVFPDRRFEPQRILDRGSLAVVIQGILVMVTGDQELATRYLGETSRFPDVRSDSYAYNAIVLNAERGIITADHLTGLFHPEAPVSGAEAMQVIRQLQAAVRFEF
jgi:tetratricopeptide (TPR) repeat protein